jgi:hypothetical protein
MTVGNISRSVLINNSIDCTSSLFEQVVVNE